MLFLRLCGPPLSSSLFISAQLRRTTPHVYFWHSMASEAQPAAGPASETPGEVPLTMQLVVRRDLLDVRAAAI